MSEAEKIKTYLDVRKLVILEEAKKQEDIDPSASTSRSNSLHVWCGESVSDCCMVW